MEREAEKVLEDVLNELITPDYAGDVYGVVIGDGEIDVPATEARREELTRTGEFKAAYLAHFYDSVDIKPFS